MTRFQHGYCRNITETFCVLYRSSIIVLPVAVPRTHHLMILSPFSLNLFPDTYVKLTMLDSKGKEISKCKTAVCRGQPNPTYKETFAFQVALFQLSEVSLVLTVFCRSSSLRPRERLGWVSLGFNSSSEEQKAHWAEMKEAKGQQVCHWHTLTDTIG